MHDDLVPTQLVALEMQPQEPQPQQQQQQQQEQPPVLPPARNRAQQQQQASQEVSWPAGDELAGNLLENSFLCRYVMAKVLQDGGVPALALLADVATDEMRETLLAMLVDVSTAEGRHRLLRLLQRALEPPGASEDHEHERGAVKRAKF